MLSTFFLGQSTYNQLHARHLWLDKLTGNTSFYRVVIDKLTDPARHECTQRSASNATSLTTYSLVVVAGRFAYHVWRIAYEHFAYCAAPSVFALIFALIFASLPPALNRGHRENNTNGKDPGHQMTDCTWVVLV